MASAGHALALALLLFLPLPAAGAPQRGAGDLWNHYSIRDGLPSANVSAVFRAGDGSLWFGTDSGAARYDGSWQVVAPVDGLPVGRVRTIAQATDGAIWFGLDRSGVARRAEGTCCQSWNRANGLPSADVRALLPAPDGGMWIGTGAGAIFYDGSKMAPLAPLADVPIWSIVRGRDGSEWFGTAGRGVWRISSGQVARVGGDELPRGEVYALWVDEAGQAWAGTDDGVYRLVGGAWQPFPLGAAAGARVFSILPDPAGGIWFGADQGLFYYDGSGSTVERFGRAGGMVSEYVRAMTLDGDGALWLGTVGGVSRYGGRIWRAEREAYLRDQAVNAVYTDRSGRTWAGADGKGVALWDGKTWRWFGSGQGLADAQVFSLYEDRSGRMWAGTASGVALWDSSGLWRSFGVAEGIANPPVWAIGDDAGGDLWIGTEKGIVRGNERKGFQPVPEFAGRRVNAVYSSADGAMWVGTHDHGLWRLRGAAWEQVTGLDGPAFSSVVLNGIAEYPAGVLWVGTYDNRLWRLEAGKWQQAEGKLSSPLVSALSANGGSLWVGTRSGLNRYDGRTWQSYAGTVLPNGEIRSIAPGSGRAVGWCITSLKPRFLG